ncbi:hypothetical protein VPH35_050367 [Triticum aestivum]|uniref:Uncharacterized protein n=2 Tax=Triticum TaxID=4564 RepID=A0A9R1QAI6_TRITD|nr:unnamed protein product [Triticum aestivum]VAH73463.1 unnamed protein product [Triticum turgidum subsp. durum]
MAVAPGQPDVGGELVITSLGSHPDSMGARSTRLPPSTDDAVLVAAVGIGPTHGILLTSVSRCLIGCEDAMMKSVRFEIEKAISPQLTHLAGEAHEHRQPPHAPVRARWTAAETLPHQLLVCGVPNTVGVARLASHGHALLLLVAVGAATCQAKLRSGRTGSLHAAANRVAPARLVRAVLTRRQWPPIAGRRMYPAGFVHCVGRTSPPAMTLPTSPVPPAFPASGAGSDHLPLFLARAPWWLPRPASLAACVCRSHGVCPLAARWGNQSIREREGEKAGGTHAAGDDVRWQEDGRLDKAKFHVIGAILFTAQQGVLHPTAVVKTRMQVAEGGLSHMSGFVVFRKILRSDGIPGVFRGFGTSAVGALLAVYWVNRGLCHFRHKDWARGHYLLGCALLLKGDCALTIKEFDKINPTAYVFSIGVQFGKTLTITLVPYIQDTGFSNTVVT